MKDQELNFNEPEKKYNVPKRILPEPVRIPDGEEFGDDFSTGSKRPKWMTPKGPIQKMILDAVDRKFYQTHNERSAIVAIEKSTLYLNSGIISVYPTEWVEQCVEWAKKKRRERMPVALIGLINLINNDDRKTMFVQKWAKDHPETILRKDAGTKPVVDDTEMDISHIFAKENDIEPPQ